MSSTRTEVHVCAKLFSDFTDNPEDSHMILIFNVPLRPMGFRCGSQQNLEKVGLRERKLPLGMCPCRVSGTPASLSPLVSSFLGLHIPKPKEPTNHGLDF